MSLLKPQTGKIPPEQTQAGMNRSSGRDFARADAEMNRLFRQVMALEDKDGQAKLREAQRAWLKFRDANAAYESAYCEGGTMHPMAYSGSQTAATEGRIKSLREYLNNIKELRGE